MKKLMLFAMAILLCGCSGNTKKEDKVVDIVVKEHNETPSIGGVAMEQMIEKMKTENKYDVDTISGATKTSQALKDAVKNAYEKAKNTTE